MDKWLFFYKAFEDFQQIPSVFKGEVVFEQAFEKAALAKFDQDEWDRYESSLKIYRDWKGVIDTARMDGETKRNIEIAKSLRLSGVAMDIIVNATGLSEEEINNL